MKIIYVRDGHATCNKGLYHYKQGEEIIVDKIVISQTNSDMYGGYFIVVNLILPDGGVINNVCYASIVIVPSVRENKNEFN